MSIFIPYQALLEEICDHYKLNLYGAHGIEHWESVYANTQMLSEVYGVESKVFMLFALLHDSQRLDEDDDFEHGIRAAQKIQSYLDTGKIILDANDQKRLLYACANHTKANKNDPLYKDLIVQICLDADKLDIGRVGVIPEKSHFLTPHAQMLVEQGLK